MVKLKAMCIPVQLNPFSAVYSINQTNPTLDWHVQQAGVTVRGRSPGLSRTRLTVLTRSHFSC
jgi:hypothetical protein